MKTQPRKLIGILFTLLLFPNLSFSQDVYLGINIGYGLNLSSQNLNGTYLSEEHGPLFVTLTDLDLNTGDFTTEQINISLGKGFHAGGQVGYMFHENIGVELEISYMRSASLQANYIYTYVLNSNMLRLIPKIVIKAGLEKVNPYFNFGIVVGSGRIVFEETYNDRVSTEYSKLEMLGGIGIGTHTALGVELAIANNLSFYGELRATGLSYAPRKGRLLDSKYGGADYLENLPVRDKEVKYVKEIMHSSQQGSESEPLELLRNYLPYSSLGLHLGVRLGF